jgi:phosphatidylglycerophosphatase C
VPEPTPNSIGASSASTPAPGSRPGVAAFDVDGTLTERDCVVPFMVAVNGAFGTALGLLTRSHRVVPALVRRDRDTVKAIASSVVFDGRKLSEVNEHGKRFAERVASAWLRPQTLALLRGHQARGHDVVLVSASFGAYLRPLGDRLGVDAVVGTELALDGASCCTGELDGGNCRGDEKVRRLHAWLAARHGGRGRVELWAYGDSAGDHAMLRDADHAVWLGAERKRPAGMTSA